MNPGFTFANRFTVHDPAQDLLGRGGMGEVYRATDAQTGDFVAVKILNPEALAQDPGLLERFVREGEALRQLNHPNIVRMVAAVEENGQHYLIMEFVGGGSLQDLLATQGYLSSSQVIKTALEVADALTRAHHLGIIHRDLKPANVLLAEDGTPRLTDFGIAHQAGREHLTQTGVLVGTVDYLSPEVCQGQPPSECSDIWAFGVLLFELLTGQLPFMGGNLTATLTTILTQPTPNLTQLNPDVPDALASLVYRMLEKDPQQRIPSIRLVGAELEALSKGRQVTTPSPPPPPKAKHNLPLQVTVFIGRETEIEQVRQRLAQYRLVTLAGSGGIGKTRLALQTARELLPDYRHGAWLVELAPLANPNLVTPTVAGVLGVSGSQDRPVLTALTDYLREKTLLLVLDNCEHVIEACAQLAEHLLQQCPDLRILASSREALGVEGEFAQRVPSLSLPPAEPAGRDTLVQSEAVRLFVDRAAAAQPGFELTEANALAVAQVCRRLDGVALAIELAAARVKLLKVEQIAARLDDVFHLLTGGRRTALPRQQTLRATLDWSYNLLSETERAVLQRLAVFAGGWTLEAAEGVCAGAEVGLDASAVLDVLTQLANKSLVVVERVPGEEARYHLLETTRQYAREKLHESGEGEAVRGRHLKYYLALAEALEPKLRTAEQFVRYRQLETDLDNFRGALDWALAEARAPEAAQGLRLASALADLWYEDFRLSAEGLGWLKRGLGLVVGGDPASSQIRAKALGAAAYLAGELARNDLARAMAEESVALYRATCPVDQRGFALALSRLAWALLYDGYNYTLARARAEESIAMCRALGPAGHWELAYALYVEARAAYAQDDYETARARAQEGLALYRQAGDRILMAWTINLLGVIAMAQGDYSAARSHFEEALRLSQVVDFGGQKAAKTLIMLTMGNIADLDRLTGNYASARVRYEELLSFSRQAGPKWVVGYITDRLGRIALAEHDYAQAVKLLRESLPELDEVHGDRANAAAKLAGLAEAFRAQGELIHAARLLGAVESEFDKGVWLSATRAAHAQSAAATKAALGEAAFDAAWADGQAMTLEQAVAYALEELHEPGAASQNPKRID